MDLSRPHGAAAAAARGEPAGDPNSRPSLRPPHPRPVGRACSRCRAPRRAPAAGSAVAAARALLPAVAGARRGRAGPGACWGSGCGRWCGRRPQARARRRCRSCAGSWNATSARRPTAAAARRCATRLFPGQRCAADCESTREFREELCARGAMGASAAAPGTRPAGHAGPFRVACLGGRVARVGSSGYLRDARKGRAAARGLPEEPARGLARAELKFIRSSEPE